MNRCVLLRASLLLSLLCVCARVLVELRGSSMTPPGRVWEPAVTVATDAATVRTHRRRIPRWKIDLAPWAAETRGVQEEARRFLRYISTPQVSCERPASVPPVFDREDHGAWALCLDHRFSLAQRIASKHCRVYSLRLAADDDRLERMLAGSGCEVHCFDPSLSNPGQSPHCPSSIKCPTSPVLLKETEPGFEVNTRQMRVDVLKLDLESAEWKVLENLVLERVLDSLGLLLLELHLHWPGFEVGGDEPSVIRYWFSLLRELERAHYRLYHSYSDPNKPRLILHRNIQNASSSFVLGWVNTRFVPQG
ncbi:hypothetical protein F2P79_015820 [Pimephales promelas]|nr:hypothetical protein F2P79_015820 [Pimephales promelas]